MRLNKNLALDTAIVLALLLIGAAGYKYSPLLIPKTDLTVMPDPGCDLHVGPCIAHVPTGGQVRLALLPRPVRVSAPLDLEIQIEGLLAQQIEVDFTGVGMNMGLNRPRLSPTGGGRFTGQTTLPVCITGRMAWVATVLIDAGSSRIAIPFRFEAGA